MGDTDRMLAALAARAGERADTAGRPYWGVVQSYNPADNTARVLMQPDGVLSGWLPVLSPSVGAGWSMVYGMSPGAQVLVIPHDGDPESGAIVGAAHSVQQQVPKSFTNPGTMDAHTPAAAGEFLLRHQSGAFIRLGASGGVIINAPTETDLTAPAIQIIATSSVHVTAPSIVAAAADGSAEPLVLGNLESLFNNHTHGGGPVPDQHMTAANLTANLTAS